MPADGSESARANPSPPPRRRPDDMAQLDRREHDGGDANRALPEALLTTARIGPRTSYRLWYYVLYVRVRTGKTRLEREANVIIEMTYGTLTVYDGPRIKETQRSSSKISGADLALGWCCRDHHESRFQNRG